MFTWSPLSQGKARHRKWKKSGGKVDQNSDGRRAASAKGPGRCRVGTEQPKHRGKASERTGASLYLRGRGDGEENQTLVNLFKAGLYLLQGTRQGALRSPETGAVRWRQLRDQEQSLEPGDLGSQSSPATSGATSGLSLREISLSLFSLL